MYKTHKVKHPTFNSGKRQTANIIMVEQLQLQYTIGHNKEKRLMHDFTVKLKSQNICEYKDTLELSSNPQTAVPMKFSSKSKKKLTFP